MQKTKSNVKDIYQWLTFLAISLTIFFAYYPSLFFPPRADQVAFLAEVRNYKTPTELIFGIYDTNRHSEYNAGDELLFRPITFSFLGFEQFLFGHQFWAWQFLNIIAHILIVLILWRLLSKLTDGWLALAVAGLFGLSLVGYEIVTWSHLSVYLVMVIFLALGLDQIIVSVNDKFTNIRIFKTVCYFFIVCFMYETNNIFVSWIALFLLFFYPQIRFKALFLFIPVITYVAFSGYNYFYVHHLSLPVARISHPILHAARRDHPRPALPIPRTSLPISICAAIDASAHDPTDNPRGRANARSFPGTR